MKYWGKIIAIMAAMCFNSVNAFESGTDYNSANMSYMANSTISQIVVFDSTMQNGGTLTFTVEAHAGGGRNLQHDTGQLKLEFYNSSNTLIGSSQTSYATGNLLQMNAWSSQPGDNSEPWTTLSLTSTDCGSAGSCSSVAYVKVTMIGTDTSWWAGNYGPQWRVPTVTFTPTGGTAGNNILYNPEFGLDPSGVFAQGWTSSTGWGACGTTSGSVMCTTTATGVTANMSGGGYDANGGTTAATPGGYSGTLTTANFSGSAGGGSPTVVSTAPGTPIVTTSTANDATTTTVVDTLGATTVVETVTDTRGAATDKTLTIGRNITLVATTPVTRVTTDTTPVTTTTVTTPTTVTTYSDGSTTTTNGTPVTTTSTANQVTTTTTTFNQVVTTSSDQDYTTRIDQYSVLAETNTFNNLLSRNDMLNRQSVIDGTISFKGNVDRAGTISFYSLGEKTGEYSVDGYTVSSKRFGFGLDKLVNPNWIVGLSLARSETVLSGNSASGGLNKDILTLNSLYNMRNWLFASELGYANNEYNNSHSLPELGYANSSNTKGNDRWLGLRLYTPDVKGLRPFAGYRVEQQTRNAVTETGSALTAMSYDAIDSTTKRSEVGVRIDRQFNSIAVYGEVAKTDDNIRIARVGIRKDLSNRVSFILGATQLQRDDVKSIAGSVVLKIGF